MFVTVNTPSLDISTLGAFSSRTLPFTDQVMVAFGEPKSMLGLRARITSKRYLDFTLLEVVVCCIHSSTMIWTDLTTYVHRQWYLHFLQGYRWFLGEKTQMLQL